MAGKFQSTHSYCMSQRPDDLTDWAKDKVEKLHDMLKGVCPIFCYSGCSGISMATVFAITYLKKYGDDFGMIYVRKDKEVSHGRPVEASLQCVAPVNSQDSNWLYTGGRALPGILVFIDDTTSSGATRRHTMMKSAAFIKEMKIPNVELVEFIQILAGVVEPMVWVRDFDHCKHQLLS